MRSNRWANSRNIWRVSQFACYFYASIRASRAWIFTGASALLSTVIDWLKSAWRVLAARKVRHVEKCCKYNYIHSSPRQTIFSYYFLVQNNQRKNHKKYLVMKIMRVLLKVAALSGEGGGKEKGTNEKWWGKLLLASNLRRDPLKRRARAMKELTEGIPGPTKKWVFIFLVGLSLTRSAK